MTTFHLTIHTDNAAFAHASELSRIVHGVADAVEDFDPRQRVHSLTVRDLNGNDVGRWKITTDD